MPGLVQDSFLACLSLPRIAACPIFVRLPGRSVIASRLRAIPVAADVSNPAVVERVVQEVDETLGSEDLLVNNAGLAAPVGRPTWKTDPDAWWRGLDVRRSSAKNLESTGKPTVLAEEPLDPAIVSR
jgi:NAD(P)-dependent dehydrogenase (short-subunit alcohol dehydrogenase family)